MAAAKSKSKKMPAKKEEGTVWVSPNGVLYTEPKIDADLIKKSKENKYIIEGLSKQQRLIFRKGLKVELADITVTPPKVDEKESKVLMSMVKAKDVALHNKIQLLWNDAMEFGCGLYNDVWEYTDSNLYSMVKLNRLPPETFENCGASYALIYNRILEGIRWNQDTRETEYWQTEADGQITQLKNVGCITDPMSSEVGGTPYIIPIIPFVNMLRFLWNKKMQEANIFGAGGLYFIKVKNPQGDDTEFAQKILNNESGDVRFQLRDNMELIAITVSGTGVAIEGIQEAQSQVQTFFTSSNLIAKDGTLIGGSSQPEFDLFMAYLESTHRWLEEAVREMLLPYLDGNNFDREKYDIIVTIADLEYDKSQTLLTAVSGAYTTKSISLAERRKVYEKVGIETKELKPEEEKALLAEYEAANPQPAMSPMLQKVESLAKVISATPLDPHAFVSKEEMAKAIDNIDAEGKKRLPFLQRQLSSESMQSNQQSLMHGGPGSGRYPKGSSNNEQSDVPKAPHVKTTDDLQKVANISLPPDDDKYEYFYHATRYSSSLDSIEKNGLDPAHGAYADMLWASKDEVRDLGGGFVIFRAPTGKMTEGVDVVERGLQYREWTTREKIPPEDIVRVVKAIPTTTDDNGRPITGFTTNENELAQYLLDTPVEERRNKEGLPEEYRHWFDIPPRQSMVHGGPGSGRYPKGSSNNEPSNQSESLKSKKYDMDTEGNPRSSLEKRSYELLAMLPPREEWKDPRGMEIAEMAITAHGPGMSTDVAIDSAGNLEGLITHYEDEDGINITYLASVGKVKHVGSDLLKKAILESPGKDVNLFADPGAVTYYQHIGMEQLSGDEEKGGVFRFDADKAKAFAEEGTEHLHGGPGSGRYPKGSSGNESSPPLPSDIMDRTYVVPNKAATEQIADNSNLLYKSGNTTEKCSQERQAEFSRFCSGVNYDINTYLRQGAWVNSDGQPLTETEIKVGKEVMHEIDMTMYSANPMPAGVELYRGVGDTTAAKLIDAPIGSTCEDKAFQSFSLSPRVAAKFTKSAVNIEGRTNVIVRTFTDGKIKGINIGDGATNFASEEEVLVDRGTKYKISSKDVFEGTSNYLRTLVVTVVPI